MIKFGISNCVTFFLGQLCFVTIIKAFPLTLSVTIKNHDEEITLNWQLTQHDLANHNLPLWYARMNSEPQLIPNVMNKIGSFAMYHDIDKSSAVVYFQSADYFIGVIDTRFIVYGLPLSAINPNDYHIVGGPYIKRRAQDLSFHDNLFIPRMFHHQTDMDEISKHTLSPSVLLTSAKPSSSSNRNTLITCQPMSNKNQNLNVDFVPSRHQNVNILYAEILVFISYAVVTEFNTFADLVVHYLVHFNSVDMLFAKLAKYGVEIHINIAGLVLEAEEKVFPYVFIPGQSQQQQPHILDARETLQSFPQYLKKYENIFVEDSFDFFFLSTHYKILADNEFADGVARVDFDIHQYRTTGGYFGTNYDSIGILVHRRWEYGEFVTSAHELAHVMKVSHDSKDEGGHCSRLQCYAILQPLSSFCKNCIVWSAKSLEEFRAYASTDKNHCFLLNPPRSLYPHGTPITTIGPTEQCACYGFESYWPANEENHVEEDTCDMMLICAIKDAPVVNPVPRPFDGTPCSKNKVCWQRQCRDLITSNKM